MRSIDGFYNGVAVLAGIAILAAVGLTFVDVLLRLAARLAALGFDLRRSWGVPGLVDLTQLAILSAAALSIAVAFWRGRHVVVDILIEHFSPARQRLVQALSGVLGAGLMLGCFWFGLAEMQRQLDFPTASAMLGIAFTWYWAPLLAGLLLAAFAVLAHTIDLVLKKAVPVSGTHRADETQLGVDSGSTASTNV